MSKILPTAEEFFEKGGTYPELAIEFTKLHVQAALEAASKKADINTCGLCHSGNRNSILNAYPLNLIK